MTTKNSAPREDQLLKALDDLEAATMSETPEGENGEDEMAKGNIPEQMKSKKSANGGFSGQGGEGEAAPEFEEGQDASEGEPTAKSMMDESEDLQKAFEVSDFLKSFADVMVDAAEIQAVQMKKALDEQQDFNEKLQKAIVEIGNMVIGLKKSVEENGDQPVSAPKTVLTKSDVRERDFNGNGGSVPFGPQQTLSALTDMAMKGECDTVQVSAYESTGYLPEQLVPQVNQRLVQMFGQK